MRWEVRRFSEVLRGHDLKHALAKSYQYAKIDLLKMNNELRYELPDMVYRPFFEYTHGSGIDVAKRDWDNLIVLDAYRYDYFEKHSRFDGELERVLTRGNWSLEWVLQNFKGKELTDTVCVSGNVFYERLEQDTLFALKSLGRDPKIITQVAREMNEVYPDKRLIVHYMTPHIPHRGSISRELASEGREFSAIFERIRNGDISKETLKKSYIENVKIAESYAASIVEELEGKTVITSDHGENLGERQFGLRRFDHGHETPECRFVPWLELPYEERKTVTREAPIGFDYTDAGVMSERLEALGYR